MNSIRDNIFIREKLGAVKLYRSNLLKILWAIQDEYRHIPQRFIRYLCDRTELTPEAIHSVVSFYHFFSLEHRGDITIYLDTSMTSEMTGAAEVRKAFEKELGIKVGEVTSDMQFGLFETSCIGLSDQGPAALINHRAATHLTPTKVAKIIQKIKLGKKISSLPDKNILKTGPVFFQEIKAKKLLKQLFQSTPEEIVSQVKTSGLRGRGGAGFSTGMKWEFCRQHEGPRYLFANGDEGEPGTFKDRALFMQAPESLFLGMIIAGYAIGAMRGYLYLRAEYFYLLESLEKVLTKLRRKGLLGQQILGSSFSFEISIKFGAGAYICGEESALIESAEGKRGEPRNRPPFPVEVGYLGRPTVVNNIETLCALPAIVEHGVDWYRNHGTGESTGTKLLSVAGDCARPGIYEVELGLTVKDVLDMVGAKKTKAVQVSGPA
ncbi:MAG: NAD(P)H-dependent oxidoreductase subunit E, partial [Gammaproteobacteria bacterium]|nr:NAD(P)H-dependent oxidoreductase subunit E [Gammaproteobacteria bacterium]